MCVVMTCTTITEPEFHTCSDPGHRKLKTYYKQQGKAMFHLKHHLEQAKVSQTHNSLSSGDNRELCIVLPQLAWDIFIFWK